ncbi:hypothetical protein KHC23_07630 [Ancylobacter dichloromethanicus]|uniref:Peptidase S24/S26A/S26B/S26C domain-containing protein n=1 Tax=Ancylobacter dichloromethanicus TaxID=518825 RepID=A0A9W6JB35_9HYPH|nr:hypothetical protein [Ancylobacter dichloromethanicus]MBS7553516.1 hypothetical protein [Ancylobacter dichloromethanicus]GLK72574.1 hypothetical protein GCM10017643_26900 [Ancylobacter dichloromethanicus]
MGATAKTSETKRQLQEVHKEWIAALERTLGLKPSKIAQEAGLSDTTLTRLFWPDYAGTLSQMTIAKVKTRFGVAGPGEIAVAGATIPGFSEGDRVLFSNDNGAGEEIEKIVEAMRAGRNAVEPWRLRSRALEGEGILPGDIVMVDLNAQAAAGDAVCAQVYDLRRGTAETVFRLFEPPFLVAASSDAALRRPLLVDNERVAVVGVVVGSVRPWRLGGAR